jgi:hypothetical protein
MEKVERNHAFGVVDAVEGKSIFDFKFCYIQEQWVRWEKLEFGEK